MNQTTYNKSGNEIIVVPGHIAAAAEWWANSITNPTHDNGDKSRNGDIGSLLAMLLCSGNPVTKEQAEAFKLALIESLMEVMKDRPYFSIYVDYHPDRILAEAAREAGITSTQCFSWKTSMDISEDKVEVSEGYGAPRKVIWTKEQ